MNAECSLVRVRGPNVSKGVHPMQPADLNFERVSSPTVTEGNGRTLNDIERMPPCPI